MAPKIDLIYDLPLPLLERFQLLRAAMASFPPILQQPSAATADEEHAAAPVDPAGFEPNLPFGRLR